MAKTSTTASTSTKTGTATDAVKEKKPGRIAYPGIGAKTGYPFESHPADFDFAKHKGLGKKNFKDATAFTEYRAAQFTYRGSRMLAIGKKLADKAALERQFGSEDLRKKARKYAAMQAEMDNIRKLLTDSGIDPAKLNPPTAAAAPAATAAATV